MTHPSSAGNLDVAALELFQTQARSNGAPRSKSAITGA
jgi:hypothetical protein